MELEGSSDQGNPSVRLPVQARAAEKYDLGGGPVASLILGIGWRPGDCLPSHEEKKTRVSPRANPNAEVRGPVWSFQHLEKLGRVGGS
jgi:hypothetical protein